MHNPLMQGDFIVAPHRRQLGPSSHSNRTTSIAWLPVRVIDVFYHDIGREAANWLDSVASSGAYQPTVPARFASAPAAVPVVVDIPLILRNFRHHCKEQPMTAVIASKPPGFNIPVLPGLAWL